MYSVPGDTTSLVPGFPIRTSSDPRSVDSSPRHNAASHVLHRLLVPRHPPCALKHLQHKKPEKNKKLHHNKPHTHAEPERAQRRTQPPKRRPPMRLDARNHYPQIKHHTPPPRWSDTRLNHQPLSPAVVHPHRLPSRDHTGAGLLPHSPIVCSMVPPPGRPRKTDHRRGFRVRHCTRPPPTTGASHPPIAQYTEPPHGCGRDQVTWCSLERR